MRNKLLITFSAVSLLTACGIKQSNSESASIFGDDHRKTESSDLGKSVGPLSSLEGGSYCTAYFVSPSEVKTAIHCIDDQQPEKQYKLVTDNGEFILSLGSLHETSHEAILVSSKESANFLATSSTGDAAKLVSFDHDKGLLVSVDRTEVKPYQIAGTIAHKFDSLPGSSGSPLLDSENKVIAMHIGSANILGKPVNVASSSNKAIDYSLFESFEPECWKYNPMCGKSTMKKISKCGISIQIYTWQAPVCYSSLGTAVGSCTAASMTGEPTTAGVCGGAIGATALSCSLSLSATWRIIKACLN